MIATYLPGRTDQHIKNHFRSRLSKKLMLPGPSPKSHALVPQIEFGLPEKPGLDQLPDFKETVDLFVMSPPRHQFLDTVVAADELASDECFECFDSQFWWSLDDHLVGS